jgi:hypothetical protein
MEETTTTTMAPVMVEQILSTRNDEIFQLQLRQVVEKPAESNNLGFFLQGYPGVGDGTEQRVSFQTVSKAFIEKFKIEEGMDLAIATGKACKLWIHETFEQRTWDGGEQQPKVNPSSGDVLTCDGKPIYRNCHLVFDLSKEDVYIEHTRENATAKVEPASGDLAF